MMNNHSNKEFEFEPLHVAVVKLSLADGVSHDIAAAKIAGLVLTGKIVATGIKLYDPMREEGPCEDLQPIPPGAWADFQTRDYGSGIIRLRAGNQLRVIPLWRDIHIAVQVEAAPVGKPVKRSRADTESAVQKATQHVIELRQTGADKPGGTRDKLRAYLVQRFVITNKEAEAVMNKARAIAPNDEWDKPGKK